MKKSNSFLRFLAFVLSICMVSSVFAITASANTDSEVSTASTEAFVSETHDVYKRTQSTIAPGVTQDVVFAYAKDGKQMAYFVATADINRDDVAVYANYKDNQYTNFGMQKLTDQMAAAEKRNSTDETAPYYNPYYKAVVGVNADFYNMTTGQPSGAFAMEGTVVSNSKNRPFFGIQENGTPVIGYGTANWNTYNAESKIMEAVGGSQVLVWDGKDVTANASGSYNTERHCRTCVGITADGKVVVMSLDGRQEPYSCGGTMHELAQIMLEAGCVTAINLDGGGSTTFAARQEGQNDVTVVNRPSDGSERSISSSLLIVSTAAPSDVFDRAVLTAENTYVTPKSTVKVTATGVSPAGTSAEIPENAVWQLEDSSFGTVENGVFVSSGKTGEAVIQLAVDGVIAGETTVSVVIPEQISFNYSDMIIPYNGVMKFAMTATTNGGLNKVVLKDGDINFELSNPNLGTVDGFKFTACGQETGLTSGSVVATFAYDTSITANATLTFGRGSSVAYDFEDGDISNLSIKSGYFKKAPKHGRFGEGEIEIATKETGFVKNGEKSLAVTCDYSNFNNCGWKSLALSGLGIDLTDAISVGFWAYIPADAVGMEEVDFNNDQIASSYIKEVRADDFDGGWFYISVDGIKSLAPTLDSLYFYHQDSYTGALDDANIFTKYTIYIDDITVDYSSAVGDRELPEFSYVRASYGGLSDAVELNGQTITTDEISVTSRATDDDALDISSAKVYLDGKELASNLYTVDDTGIITTADLKLADGVHKFTFSVADVTGNVNKVTRTVNVEAESGKNTITFVPQNPDADRVFLGSVHWYDLKATDISKVDTVTTTIDLDSMSDWELDHMVVADGFTADYTIDKFTNDATITITRTGKVTATGEAVLASLPVRAWAHINHLRFPNDVYTGSSTGDSDMANSLHTVWKTDATANVAIIIAVDYGYVEFTDETSATFSSDEYLTNTELFFHRDEKAASAEIQAIVDAKYALHEHRVGEPTDKAATCTEAGYTGRTFCVACACPESEPCDAKNGCGSIVDWGTTIPATGHTYEFIDGVRKCACGELYNGEYEGNLYVDGALANAWVDDSYYTEGTAVTGIQKVDGYYYDFGDNGVCDGKVKYTGLFYDTESNVYRYSQLGELSYGWKTINNEWYYFFQVNMAAATGRLVYGDVVYTMDVTGRLTSGVWRTTDEGTMYYYGPRNYTKCWATIDGNEYYFDSNGYRCEGYQIVKDSWTNPNQWYQFGEDGVLIEKLTKTGLLEANGALYYLEDGISKNGLYYVDGYYYYFKSDLTAVTGKYYVTHTNGLLPQGDYMFGEDHKMVIKNGLVEENGGLYYYVDGKLTYAGLIEVDGAFYYINSSCKAVTGKYYVNKNNDVMPQGDYTFGEDGKMLIKHGLVEENGGLYYYVKGKLTYAGLIEIDGDFYYINSKYKAVTGKYYVNKNNDIMPQGDYNFGEDGKMLIKHGLVQESDGLYYYVKGQLTYAGLIEIDGNFYYINSMCKAVTGTYYVNKTNDLMDQGEYTFDENGKMYIKHGLVEENGELYYYEKGKLTYAGLIIVDGDYYYINSKCKAVTGLYYVNKNNDLLPQNEYNFGADGKMILD